MSNITMCPECGNAFHDHCFDCSYRPIQGLELSLEEMCVVGEMAYKKGLLPAQLFKQALRCYQMRDDDPDNQIPLMISAMAETIHNMRKAFSAIKMKCAVAACEKPSWSQTCFADITAICEEALK